MGTSVNYIYGVDQFTQFTTDQIKFSHTFENKLLS